jgi:hypothetical protein
MPGSPGPPQVGERPRQFDAGTAEGFGGRGAGDEKAVSSGLGLDVFGAGDQLSVASVMTREIFSRFNGLTRFWWSEGVSNGIRDDEGRREAGPRVVSGGRNRGRLRVGSGHSGGVAGTTIKIGGFLETRRDAERHF